MITRQQATPLSGLLRDRGLVPVHVPLIRVAETDHPPPPGRPAVVVLTSAQAARAGARLQVFEGAGVVAVGAATARALGGVGVEVDVVGREGGAAAVAAASRWVMESGSGAPATLWYVGAEQPSAPLAASLDSWPHGPVQRWAVYRREDHPDAAHGLAHSSAQVVCFASGSAARVYARVAPEPRAPCVALGPHTAEVAGGLGLSVVGVAERPTLEALADAAAAVIGQTGVSG